MTEYFYRTASNAAPFVSDEETGYIEVDGNAETAIEKVVAEYRHPAGLYAAEVWANADDFHKKVYRLTAWRSERAQKHAAGIREDA